MHGIEFSVQHGAWSPLPTNLRVMVPDDLAGYSLHINITSEGVIMDVVHTDSGELMGTSCQTFDSITCDLLGEG